MAACPPAAAECTGPLMEALTNPDANVVIVPATPRSLWPVHPLALHLTNGSNRKIVFQPGVVVEAVRGAFKNGTASLLTLTGVENVTIEGSGATLRMWRDDYANASLYSHSESRMGLQLFGVRNLTVRGLAIESTGGDGIYLAGWGGHVVLPNGTRVYVATRNESKDVRIEGVHCRDNYRQGLSVISAANLTVTGSSFTGTNGTCFQTLA